MKKYLLFISMLLMCIIGSTAITANAKTNIKLAKKDYYINGNICRFISMTGIDNLNDPIYISEKPEIVSVSDFGLIETDLYEYDEPVKIYVSYNGKTYTAYVHIRCNHKYNTSTYVDGMSIVTTQTCKYCDNTVTSVTECTHDHVHSTVDSTDYSTMTRTVTDVCVVCGNSITRTEEIFPSHNCQGNITKTVKLINGLYYVTYSCEDCGFSTTISETDIAAYIKNLSNIFYQGMTWGFEKEYSWNSGIYAENYVYACTAFAFSVSDKVFDNYYDDASAKGWYANEEQLHDVHVGDLIQYLINGSTQYNSVHDSHIVVVIEKYDDHVIVVEGNYDGYINWGRSISYSELSASGAAYVISRY